MPSEDGLERARPGPEGVQPAVFQSVSGTQKAPWELGRTQMEVARLVEAGVLNDKHVLNVGCCTGDNAIHIARDAANARDCL